MLILLLDHMSCHFPVIFAGVIYLYYLFSRIQRLRSSLLTASHTVSNTYAQVAIVCKSRETHRTLITCNMSCYVPSGTKGNSFGLFFFNRLNHQTNEGGEETGVPGENPWRRASENAPYYRPKSQAPSETRIRTVAMMADYESRHAEPLHHTSRRCLLSCLHRW